MLVCKNVGQNKTKNIKKNKYIFVRHPTDYKKLPTAHIYFYSKYIVLMYGKIAGILAIVGK